MSDLIKREDALKAVNDMTELEDDYLRCTNAINAIPTVEQEEFEWCHDCKEYDQEKHCCPRWNKLIRQTIKELEEQYKPKRGEWLELDTCSVCGKQSYDFVWGEIYEAEKPNYCPNCGADMKVKESE